MPNATFIHDDFCLADVEGHAVCSIRDVALDLEYSTNGLWRIIGVGFVTDTSNPYHPRCAWFQETTALEQMIIARAMSHYRAEIDEFVWDMCRRDEVA